jgi:hypothetical protein
MVEYTDAEAVIKHGRPGMMIFGRVKQAISSPWQTVFYIREDYQHIKAIPPNPIIEVRMGIMYQDNVYLFPLILKLAGEIYECWFNYHASGVAEALGCFSRQEQNVILIYGDSLKQERSIAFKNSQKEAFCAITDVLKNNPVWSMVEFDQARNKLYALYKSPQELWNVLK